MRKMVVGLLSVCAVLAIGCAKKEIKKDLDNQPEKVAVQGKQLTISESDKLSAIEPILVGEKKLEGVTFVDPKTIVDGSVKIAGEDKDGKLLIDQKIKQTGQLEVWIVQGSLKKVEPGEMVVLSKKPFEIRLVNKDDNWDEASVCANFRLDEKWTAQLEKNNLPHTMFAAGDGFAEGLNGEVNTFYVDTNGGGFHFMFTEREKIVGFIGKKALTRKVKGFYLLNPDNKPFFPENMIRVSLLLLYDREQNIKDLNRPADYLTFSLKFK